MEVMSFVKKSDEEDTELSYRGQVVARKGTETTMRNDERKSLPIMNMQLELQHSVRDDIYDYFVR